MLKGLHIWKIEWYAFTHSCFWRNWNKAFALHKKTSIHTHMLTCGQICSYRPVGNRESTQNTTETLQSTPMRIRSLSSGEIQLETSRIPLQMLVVARRLFAGSLSLFSFPLFICVVCLVPRGCKRGAMTWTQFKYCSRCKHTYKPTCVHTYLLVLYIYTLYIHLSTRVHGRYRNASDFNRELLKVHIKTNVKHIVSWERVWVS